MEDKPLRKHRGQSARALAYTHILNAIVDGTYAPGTLLSESDLATHLNVSRQPVREAMILIASNRLVTVRPQSGTYVAYIDPEEVRQAQFIREAIEVSSLELCTNIPPNDLDTLKDCIRQQREATSREEFYPLDENFHRALLTIPGNTNAWSLVTGAKAHLDRVRYLGLEGFRDIQRYVDDHANIVNALAGGDITTAQNAMRTHLRFVLDDLNHIRERYPEYFEPPKPGRRRERPTQ
ncbi:GntR family transcriptional regulator [Bifidobacterium simiarum]|uniref:GntR family transcriptional regulator n=1 Tax=Bifidobacterium simiarum TaxID=2045441 RepID=A0A2M9HFU7_9BIFI|nr:GntR family transcriptional regulator [Bifidobacterium simiarum]PJM75677.1 GntR family transcriptional regulator [Bifidobacterium simiarum]